MKVAGEEKIFPESKFDITDPIREEIACALNISSLTIQKQIDILSAWLNSIDNPETQRMYIPDCFAEAFAKRIIKECLFVCEYSHIPFDVNVWRESTKKEMTKLTAIALVEKIKKHFSVENE